MCGGSVEWVGCVDDCVFVGMGRFGSCLCVRMPACVRA